VIHKKTLTDDHEALLRPLWILTHPRKTRENVLGSIQKDWKTRIAPPLLVIARLLMKLVIPLHRYHQSTTDKRRTKITEELESVSQA
jgi:hypothetical protein